MSSNIPDFTEAEQKLVSAQLLYRYGKAVPLQLADSELQLDPASDELTLCPTLYWCERGAHFVVCKVGEGRYRSQFFYSETEHYGTGKDEYEDLRECAVTLLQVQADHERQLAAAAERATEAKIDSNYDGPMMI
ncbi:MAG TPA: hypothetical protein VFK88_02705 [Gallionella sp.]|nr:hypothetical protein [Gallionella sp.]